MIRKVVAGTVFCLMLGHGHGQEHELPQADDPTASALTFARLRLGARLMIDGASVERSDEPRYQDWEVRRARLSLSAKLSEAARLTWQQELSGHSPRVIEAAITFKPAAHTRMSMGLHKEPLGIDELTPTSSLRFLERSQANLFAPGYNQGLSLHSTLGQCALSAGLFAPHAQDLAHVRDDQRGITSRAACHANASDDTLIHMGVAATRRDVTATQRPRFRPDKESRLASLDWIRTRSLRGVDEYWIHTLEAGIQSHRWLVLGEYAVAEIDYRNTTPSHRFSAWHVAVGSVLRGSPPRYKRHRGTFERSHESSLEWALRRSQVDLNHDDVQGGRQHSTTLTLTWRPTPHLNLQWEAVHAGSVYRGTGASARILQFRLGWTL